MTRPDSNIPLSIDFALIALALSILTPPTSDAALMHANACAARGVVVCARCTAIGTEGQAARRCNYMRVYWWQLVSAHSSHYLPSKTASATHWHSKRYDSANDAGIRQPPKCQLPSMKRASAPRWRNTLYPQKNLSPLALSVKCAQAGGVVADDCSNCEIRCALHSADMPRHQISATSERSECRGWCGVLRCAVLCRQSKRIRLHEGRVHPETLGETRTMQSTNDMTIARSFPFQLLSVAQNM